MIIALLFAPLITPYSPNAQDIAHRFAGPSSGHLLGTDDLGRDLFSRLIYGCRVAFSIALPAVGIALVLGSVLGVIAGWFGRLLDSTLIIVTDALLAFPAVVLALAVIALYGPSTRNTIILVGLAFVPNYFRVTRALVLAARSDVYVDAERALGARTSRILSVHVLPNILPPLFILVAMDIPGAIAVAAGLSLPRPGRAAADRRLGRDAQRGLPKRVRLGVAADRAVRRTRAGDARVYIPRRDAARRVRPTSLTHAVSARPPR